VQININKKTFIYLGIIILVFFAGIFTDRYTRFGRTSGTSEQLIEGIVLSGDDASRVLDELGIARSAGQSAADLGYAVSQGIEKLCYSNEVQRVFIDDIRREVDIATENAKIINDSFNGVSDAVDYGWNVILEEARTLERIANRTREFEANTSENDKKPE
jgi:hypothetical protein